MLCSSNTLICSFVVIFRNYPLNHTKSQQYYSNDIEEDAKKVEKSVEKRSRNDATKIFTKQPIDRPRTLRRRMIIVIEVPLDSISRNNIIDYLNTCLHESLMNCIPQTNSMKLSTCRKVCCWMVI